MAVIFRPEVMMEARRRSSGYGQILLARPVSHQLLAWLFGGMTLAVLVLLATCSYTRKAATQGVLLPARGVIRVVPLQAGMVAERRVHEGQAVKAGDVMFVLVSERASSSHGNAEQNIAALLQRRRASLQFDRDAQRLQAEQRLQALRHKADELRTEDERIAGQLLLQQRRVALAEAALQRIVDLSAQNFVSTVQVQDKQVELLDQQQRLADLQRARGAAQRDAAAVQEEMRSAQTQAQRDVEAGERTIGDTERELAENEARRQVYVRAPEDGVATAITADVGQSVSAMQMLASLLPAGSPLEAELYVPSRAAGFLRPGMQVMLRHQAYAYQKFGQTPGTVREVSSTAMRPDEMAGPGATLLASATVEPLYRVRVALSQQAIRAFGSDLALKPGGVVDASILLETRRLYEWVLEPLYTIKGKV